MLRICCSRLLRVSVQLPRLLVHQRTFASPSGPAEDKKPAVPSPAPASSSPPQQQPINPSNPAPKPEAVPDEAKTKKAEEDIRTKILYVGMLRAMDEGWTRSTLQNSARDVGFTGSIDLIFPKGPIELVVFARRVWLNRMKQGLEDIKKSGEKLHTAEWIYRGLKLELELALPYKKNWHQVMLLGLEPGNMLRSFSTLNRVFDLIWRYAGDQSIDFSYYTKRLAMTSIYVRAELFMLFDKSPDHAETWKFLRGLVDSLNAKDFLRFASLSTVDLPKIACGVADIASQLLGDWANKNKFGANLSEMCKPKDQNKDNKPSV